MVFFNLVPTQSPAIGATAGRLVRTVWICIVVAASLFTFPAWLPVMTGTWILWSVRRLFREKPAWQCLFGCTAVLLIKRVGLTPAVTLLVATIVAFASLDIVSRRAESWTRKRRWIATITLGGTWLFMAWDWQAIAHRGKRMQLDAQRPVVCVGDSLTSGIAPYGGYPEKLRKLVPIPVINLGREGITSNDALKELATILDANPQAVVIELGGHDYLKGFSRSATKANLEELIEACHGCGAAVVLMEIPRGFITDPFAGMERQIAREYDVEIVSDGAIRQLVLWSPIAPPGIWTSTESHLSDDGLHPNRRGNDHLAQCVAEALQRIFGSQIAGGRRPLR